VLRDSSTGHSCRGPTLEVFRGEGAGGLGAMLTATFKFSHGKCDAGADAPSVRHLTVRPTSLFTGRTGPHPRTSPNECQDLPPAVRSHPAD
jgi:hypothetical protein